MPTSAATRSIVCTPIACLVNLTLASVVSRQALRLI